MNKVVYMNLFIVSFVIMGLEMTATRLIAPSFGNTVYTWGIVIAVFLIGSTIGYMAGGYVSDKDSINKEILKVLYFMGLVSVSMIPAIKDMSFPYLSSFSSVGGTFIGVVILYFIPNVLFSSIGTVLMKDGLEEEVSGRLIGNLHTASSLGSVMGTLVTTFWLIPITNINAVIGIFSCLILLAYCFYSIGTSLKRVVLLLCSFIFVCIPFAWTSTQPDDVMYHTNSLYHDIVVYQTDHFEEQEGNYRYLTFGNDDSIQGIMDMRTPNKLVLNYTRNIWKISKAFAPESQEIFMIGHGIGSLTSQFENAGKAVKVAELDKTVLEVSQKYFQYEGDSVEIGDGRKILSEQKENFDVIILDAYHNTNQIPFHLISKEFFSLTYEKLDDAGILIINAIGTPGNDIVIESMNTTLESTYPYVYLFAEDGYHELQNLTFVASKKPIEADPLKGQRNIKVKKGELILDADTKLENLN
ncbi:fused MFS/spermidine synthase [Peribacillus sp. SCS-155]|uniref:fused MFS/spermidine synthase n=1 Tax=Peribacillus sedimenti TaxID=3115297 RepID=UPI003905AC02